MKAIHLVSLFLGAIISTSGLSAQSIISVTTSPATPIECINTIVTVTGNLSCANAVVQGTSSQIIGNTVFVYLDFTQGVICLPAIVPYSLDTNLGIVPAGEYTLQVESRLNGALMSVVNVALEIFCCDPITMTKSCCDSVYLDDPTILTGIYEAMIKISASGNVPPGQSVNFTSGGEILLSDGFGVDSNSIFTAQIGPCSDQ